MDGLPTELEYVLRSVEEVSTVPIAVFAAVVAFAVCSAMVPVAIRIGRRWQFLDVPDDRKQHPAPVPRTGGVAVAGGLAAGCLVAFVLGAFSDPSAVAGGALPFITATTMVFAIGLLDDARGCSAGIKLLVQSAAAILIVSGGHAVEVVTTPFGPMDIWGGPLPGAASVLGVVWLVGITNAINFMDGLDGLAAGLASIIAGCLAVFAAAYGDPATVVVALVLWGACAGFLPHNWKPAGSSWATPDR